MKFYFNNELRDEDSPVLTINNRGYRYGDGLFESIRMFDGNVPWIHQHLVRLLAGMKYLNMRTDAQPTVEDVYRKVRELTRINNTGNNARIRINVTRRGGGLYVPDGEASDITIQVAPIPGGKLTLNNKGLTLGTFAETHKSCGELANFKTTSALVYVAASMYAREHQFDDCVVFNAFGRVADTIQSNLFVYANSAVFTPALREGGVSGVMRRIVIDMLHLENIQVVENTLGISELEHADEIFTTNAVSGIKWVRKFGQHTFGHSLADRLVGSINEKWKLT